MSEPVPPWVDRGSARPDDSWRLGALGLMDRWVDPLLLFLAAASIPMLIIQLGDAEPADQRLTVAVAWIVWGAFTANFVVRIALAVDRLDELRRLAVDLVLIVGQPIYVIGPRKADAGLALIRLLVVLGRAFRKGRVVRRTGQKLRTAPLRVVAFIVPFVWLTSAALVYRFERDGDVVPTFFDGLWWSAVTMATVGYGDISPKTEGGRIVAGVTMLVGIGMFSLVTAKLAELLYLQNTRQSRREVIEQDHVLIIGWSPKVFTIVDELLAANASRRESSIVVMADLDHGTMREQLEAHVPRLSASNTVVVCRTGEPRNPADLALCRPDRARAVIVVDDSSEDASVVRAVLALGTVLEGDTTRVVAEIDDPATAEALRLALSHRVLVVNPTAFIARTTAQVCRSAGVARAYEDLLNFSGAELYVVSPEGVVGLSVGDASARLERGCIFAVAGPDEGFDLNPDADRVITEGDRLVVLAPDDSTISWTRTPDSPPNTSIEQVGEIEPDLPPEHIVVFGWNSLAPAIMRELDGYVSEGSRITVVYDPALVAQDGEHPSQVAASLRSARLEARPASGQHHAAQVEGLAGEVSDHAIVLCYRDVLPVAEADARALVTTLQVRKELEQSGRDTTLVTELLDERDVALAPPATAGEFIVSERLVSLLLAQLAENPELAGVFDDLLDPAGAEIYCKPAGRYCRPGIPTTFDALARAAARRGETAIGFRVLAWSNDAARDFGMVLVPDRSAPITLSPADQVVVLAEDGR